LNKSILNIEIQEFINDNLNSDISKILLKGTSFKSVTTKEIVVQIEAKKKCKKKLPTWFSTTNIYYPKKLNIEQTSSEITADYKAKLIKGNTIIDLTGGFGIDSYYFSKYFKNVTHCEINSTLSGIVEHNYKQLGIENIHTIHSDGIEYLKNSTQTFDCIYVDPSRRHNSKGKVFFLKDCLPNVTEYLGLLFSQTNNIIIKTSPLLDISVGLSELKFVKEIHVVAINNEVKELLWFLELGFNRETQIKTINIKNAINEKFSFLLNEESLTKIKYTLPQSYLYEPNAAILKSGAFNSLANKFNIYKLHKHSHLYTSNNLFEFPGRVFKIEKTLPYNKKLLKKEDITKANISIRNFPETVQQIRKKLNIKDGGIKYLFFTTNNQNEKIVLLTSKN
jgi:hypothetical protein